MNDIAQYEDTQSWNDVDIQQNVEDKCHIQKVEIEYDEMYGSEVKKQKTGASSRIRPTLRMKLAVVNEYYDFIKTNELSLSCINGFSIRNYVETVKGNSLKVNNLSKWVRAERRGEYKEWDGLNRLDSYTCKVNNIVRRIDFILKARDPHHGRYNQVTKSPSLPGEYGIIARKFIPPGTFLGFYKGEVINGAEANRRVDTQEYMFALARNKFIDAKAFDSCFARYYNCALKACDQNVSVERLPSSNPLKQIGFIANREIPEGAELFISYGSAYWERAALNAPQNSPFRKVCNLMIFQQPGDFETLDPKYSLEAPVLAANFGDNSDVEQDVQDVTVDSDYVDDDDDEEEDE
jgi:hypothetical protein